MKPFHSSARFGAPCAGTRERRSPSGEGRAGRPETARAFSNGALRNPENASHGQGDPKGGTPLAGPFPHFLPEQEMGRRRPLRGSETAYLSTVGIMKLVYVCLHNAIFLGSISIISREIRPAHNEIGLHLFT